MNILFLSELIYPHGSGAELATYRWAELLARSGCNVKILTHRFADEPEQTKLGNLTVYRRNVLRLESSMKYSMLVGLDVLVSGLMKQLLRWAEIVYIPRFWYSAIPLAKASGRWVVVHLHDYQPICSLATMYDLSRNVICGSPFLCNPNCLVAFEVSQGKSWVGTYVSSALNFGVWRLAGKLAALSDDVICVSKAQLKIISQHSAVIAGGCHVVHNPLPNEPLIDRTGRDIGYFGGPNPLKGFNLLLQALKQTNHTMTVHATKFHRNREMLLSSSNHSRILFYDKLPQESYNALYQKIQTILVPSLWAEPWAYVVTEALYHRRLVIASETGGIPEQTKDCPGVFLFSPSNPTDLAELMEYTNSLDDETSAELGAKNREAVVRKYNDEIVLREMYSVLDNCEP